MNPHEMREYMREEIRQINLFREAKSRELGLEINRNEASLMWVDTRAEDFRRAWFTQKDTHSKSALFAG